MKDDAGLDNVSVHPSAEKLLLTLPVLLRSFQTSSAENFATRWFICFRVADSTSRPRNTQTTDLFSVAAAFLVTRSTTGSFNPLIVGRDGQLLL